MPSQEDRVQIRFGRMKAFIELEETVNADRFYAWVYMNLGIREKTAQKYVSSMELLGAITLSNDSITWNGKSIDEKKEEKKR